MMECRAGDGLVLPADRASVQPESPLRSGERACGLHPQTTGYAFAFYSSRRNQAVLRSLLCPRSAETGFPCSGLASTERHLWLSNCAQSSASASSSAGWLELNCKLHRSQIPRAMGVRFTTRRSRFGMALLSGFECSVWWRDKQAGQKTSWHTAHASACESHIWLPQSEHSLLAASGQAIPTTSAKFLTSMISHRFDTRLFPTSFGLPPTKATTRGGLLSFSWLS